VTGDAIRFAFPGNAGGFRGVLATDGRTIAGFWLQPAGDTKDRQDPGGSSQAFASPLVLKRAGESAWRGTVQPLEDRFTLYLRIFRGGGGSLLGAFRNPEQGDSVTFAARPNPAEPEVRMNATLVVAPERLRIHWPDAGRDLELTRRTPSEAAGFSPRPPGEAKYVYRQPPDTGDGWATARAADAGMDEAVLARLVQRLIDAEARPRGVLLRLRSRGAARPALRGKDLLLGAARRGHETGREDRARDPGLPASRGLGPVREPGPEEVNDHARASPDPHVRTGVR
jgi:hypothetical protein